MAQRINERYLIHSSESVVSILKKMKEYDINYNIEMEHGDIRVRCYNMDVGQQNIMSSFGKLIKKISWY